MRKINTKIKLRILSVCICLFSLVCTGCSGSSSSASGYTDAKNGVVVVCEYLANIAVEKDGQYMTVSDAEQAIAHGSGFFIGNTGENPQYLITNYHVIEDYMEYNAGETFFVEDTDGIIYYMKSYLRVYFDSSDYAEAYVVDYNKTADVAVLRLEKPTDARKALLLCSPTNDMVGSKVYAIGYPGLSDNLSVDSVTSWGLDDITLTSGIISRLTTTSGTGVQSIQIDVAIKHGNSGGPLVNESGSVLGINTWSVTNSSAEETNYAVNIDEVIALLNLHSIPYATESSAGHGANPAVIIGICAAVAVIAVILILVILKGRKSSGEKSGTPSQPASQDGGYTPAPPAPPSGSAAPGRKTDPQDSGFRLQGVSGALEGRRFMIRKDSPLTLGRNPDICNVTFPANTTGVSNQHCQIWYDHGKIYIKDLGSSHGTFLVSGAKLAANQPMLLSPGESFSLGSEEQTLVLVQKGGN
ncbi:MAG: trypsin-like peptidase domain-containing protein [Blautia sp.]|nr:trypsin-like peptidase domain-containing protein [Blautia sp.]